MKLSIRRQLLAVVLLAVVLCAISIGALVRIIGTTATQRLARGKTLVEEQLRQPPPAIDEPVGFPEVIGMRAGVLPGGVMDDHVDPGGADARQALRTLAAAVPTDKADVVEVPIEEGVLLVGALRDPSGAVRWITYPVRNSRLFSLFRMIVIALSVVATAMAIVTLGAIVAMTRDTRALRGSLRELARDLSAPVPRPVLGELAEVADGVSSLARSLADAERSRDELRAQLAKRERLAALGRVAAGVAHEVRNPLAAMKLRLDSVCSSPETDAALVRELEMVTTEISRLDRLVGDLLVVAGRRAGPRESTDVAALAAERARHLAPWAEERGVRVETRGVGAVTVSRDGVTRAVDNLLRNAVEAAPSGSAVVVDVQDTAEGGVVLSVQDDGDGVPPEREPELFEPFFTTKAHGTGLGLALCRAVALSEGGSVRYARKEDRTCFELRLPG